MTRNEDGYNKLFLKLVKTSVQDFSRPCIFTNIQTFVQLNQRVQDYERHRKKVLKSRRHKQCA